MVTFVRNWVLGIIVLIGLLVAQPAQSQTVQKQSVTVCKGDAVTLSAGGGDLYSWSDGSTGSSLDVVTASTEKKYTVTVTSVIPSGNLVVNGDFSSTTKNFVSQYGDYNNSGTLYDGQSWIGPNAHDVHSAFVGYDHTVGDGVAPNNFLVVNGLNGVKLWEQSITVIPNTTYAFSCWVSTLTKPTAIKFSINGTQIGQEFEGSNLQNDWKQFFILWNSGTATSATIELVDVQTKNYFDDFGIDDISFSPVSGTSSIIEYTVSPRNCGLDTLYVSACANKYSDLMAIDDATSYLWDDGSTAQKRTINPIGPTNYTVTVTKAAVSFPITYVVSTQYCPYLTTKLIEDCESSMITLSAEGGSNFLWTDKSTKSSLSVLNKSNKSRKDTVVITQPENLLGNGEFNSLPKSVDYPYNFYWGSKLPTGNISTVRNASDAKTGLVGIPRPNSLSYNEFLIVRNSLSASSGQVFRRVEATNISPNTAYDFSFWYAAFEGQASFHVLVNGVQIGQKIELSKPLNTWVPFSYVWNSGTATSVVIEFVNDNTTVDSYYGFDDIELRARPRAITFDLRPKVCVPSVADTIKITNCANQTMSLLARHAGTYKWDDGTTARTRSVNSTPAGNYSVTVSGSLIQNGDFSQGNNGFSSQYVYNGSLGSDSAYYQIESNAASLGFTGGDHSTGSGASPDNFMAVYDFKAVSKTFWQQSVSVISNTDYSFSFWVKTYSNSARGTQPGTAQVLVMVNGAPVGSVFYIPSSNPGWTQCVVRWNSGVATTAKFELVALARQRSYQDYLGALFGVDDISLSVSSNEVVEVFAVNPVSCSVTLSVCEHENVTLTRNDGFKYVWSTGATTNTTTLSDVTAAQQVYVTVSTNQNNVISNGGFDDPMANIGADPIVYTPCLQGSCSPDLNAGRYWIGANANDIHGAFVGTDRKGSGNILVVNGSSITNVAVWSQTVNVAPNTDYAFSAWLANMYPTSPAILQFKINGVLLGSTFTNTDPVNVWNQFYTIWNSGSATTATIEIMNQNSAGGGNDFGLDDISLSPIQDMVYTYNITPIPCDINIINNDTTICHGDSLELHVRTTGQLVGWSPDSVINRPSMADSWAKPLTTNTYTATAKFLKANLITNGDFEQGVVDFTSDYSLTPSTTALGPGKYFVSTNTIYGSTTWPRSFTDHTSGSGKMMVFDGDNVGNKRAYSTTVSVVAGTKYLFSTWIKNVHKDLVTNPPLLQFNVDGVDLGQIKFPINEPDWISFSTPYIATKTGIITIDIRNKNTNSARNDFALDDIFFGEYSEKTDQVTVTVAPLPSVSLGKDTTIWAGTPLKLDAGVADSYEWNVPTPHATTQTISVTNAGTYIVTVSNAAGCKASDSIVVKEKVGEMAYYRFCGCSMKDYTGNGFNATLNGPPTPTCVNSIFDQGYHFAGDMAEYIQPKTLPELTQSFSLMAWIKPEAYFGNSITPIFTQGYSEDWITLWFTPTEIQILLNYQQPTQLWSAFPAVVPLDQYSHVAATYDYDNHLINIYLNGKLVGSTTYNYPIVSANEGFYIGSSYPGGDEFFTGVIDEVRIFNKPLLASQIDSIFKITNKTKIDLGKDQLLEAGVSTNLTAPAGYSAYRWQDASLTPNYAVSKPGTYSVKVTDADGCWYVDTVKIRYRYRDTLTYTVCNGSQYILRSFDADTIRWEDSTADKTKTLTATAGYKTWVDMIVDSVINRLEFDINTINCTLDVNADSAICAGDSARLAATTTGKFMGWHPGAGLTDSMKLATHWVKPTTDVKYVASARFPQNNLLMNGDFERGNTGFKTDYGFTTSITPGEYFVGKTPYNSFTSSWARDFPDHTSGSGKMMVVDGNSTPNARVYYTTIFVNAGSQYTFSVWVKGVHKDANLNPAKLRFYVGSDALGAIDYPKASTKWIQFSTVWTATTTGNVEIGIKNQNTQSMGNDFVLDDMQFGEFTEITDTVKVSIKPKPTVSLGPDVKLCSNDSVVVTATSPSVTTFSWSSSTNTSDTIQIWSTGTYRVSVTENGCVNSDTIKVTIDSIPTVDLGEDWSIDCKEATSRKLDAGTHAYYGWSTGETTKTIVPTAAGKYFAEVATLAGCKAKDSVNIGFKCDGPKFNCNGSFYLSTTQSTTHLNEVRFNGAGIARFDLVGSDSQIDYNAIGFNYLDNYIYAYDRSNRRVIRIYADGTFAAIGNPVGLPTSEDFYIGDCDQFGNYVLVSSTGNAYVIDVMGVYPKIIKTYKLQNINPATASTGNNVADVAVHPETGLIYYFSATDKSLYKTDITTGVPQKISISSSSNIDMITAMWFDAFGNIYGYGTPSGGSNQTTLFKINSGTGADMVIAQGPRAAGTDGCSCAYFVDMFKTPNKYTVNEGDTVRYSFAIGNSTRAIQKGYTFVDTLPKGMQYISYPTTILGTSVVKSVTSDGRDVITATNTTIPEGFTRFDVTVKVLCVSADVQTSNTARIPDLPAIIGGPVVSDDSTTIILDDPAIVSINNFALPSVSVDVDKLCPDKSFTLTAQSAAAKTEWFTPKGDVSVGLSKKYDHVDSTATGIYRFAATNNGCVDTAKVTVTVYPQPRPKISSKDAVCKGETLTLDAGSFASYQWSTSAATKSIDVTDVGKKSLIVTVTDVNGCQATASKDVEVYDLPKPQITASADSVCKGTTITLDAGTFKAYKWSTAATTKTIDVSNLGKQSFKVTVTDDHDCSDTTSKIVKVNDLPTPVISATKLAVCKGGIINLSTDTYKTYSWTSGATTQSILVSDVGVHNVSVTVTDANNCTNSSGISVEVYALPVPHILASADSVCKNNTITLNAGVFAKYQWSNAETTQIVNVSDVGRQVFKLTVTDNNNCSDTTSKKIRIYDLPAPSITASKDAVCKGEKITLDAGAFTAYKWSTNAGTQTIEVSKLGTSQLTVTVTDANTCMASATKTVVVNDLPSPVITTNVPDACFGNTITFDAGTYAQYEWSSGESSQNVSVTSVGVHSLTLTVTDANQCKNSTSKAVEIYALPQPTILASKDAVCFGNTIMLSTQAYKTYSWSTQETSPIISIKDVGVHNVSLTVTDTHDCSATATKSVEVYAIPKPQIVSTDADNTICADQNLTLSLTQTYKTQTWLSKSTSDIFQTPTLPAYSTAGIVNVKVTDNNDCVGEIETSITVNPLPVVSFKPVSPQCDKYVLVPQVTIAIPMSYVWDDKTTDARHSFDIPAGQGERNVQASVTVTSDRGCTGTASASFVLYKTPDPKLKTLDSTCEYAPIDITNIGAKIPNEKYQWYFGNSKTLYDSLTTETGSTLKARDKSGFYIIRAYNHGCSDTAVMPLVVYPRPQLSVSGQDICYNQKFQPVTLNAKKGAWFSDPLGVNQVSDSLQYTPIFDSLELERTIYAQITDKHGCESKILPVVVRRIKQRRDLTIVGDTLHCENERAESEFYIGGRNKTDIATWYPASQLIADSIYPYTGFRLGVDTIKVVLTDVYGCEYTITQKIYTSPRPRADFTWKVDNSYMTVAFKNTSDSSVVPDINTKLSNRYAWTYWKGDEIWQTSRAEDSVLAYPYGYHDVKLLATNSYGCTDTILQNVFVDIVPRIYVPNIFDPEHPSLDIRTFLPKAISLINYEIWIYDQWGNMLWYSNKLYSGQPAEGWDGSYKGMMMKSDTYIWKIKAQFSSGVWWKTSDGDEYVFGNFLLVR